MPTQWFRCILPSVATTTRHWGYCRYWVSAGGAVTMIEYSPVSPY